MEQEEGQEDVVEEEEEEDPAFKPGVIPRPSKRFKVRRGKSASLLDRSCAY